MFHTGVGFESGAEIKPNIPPHTSLISLHSKHWIVVTPSKTKLIILYFFNQTPRLLFFFAVCFSASAIQGKHFISLESQWIATTAE